MELGAKTEKDMSEFKGTKGKWYSEPDDFGKVRKDDGNLVCQCFFTNDINEKQQYPNALLISKAPELLKKLKESQKVIEWYMDNAKPDNNHTDFFNIGMNQRSEIQELIESATELK